jgi:P4 family phage/plasmid primase-like protien
MNCNSNNDETYDIFTFLTDHLVENGKTHTHTSMFNPKGCYFIKTNELDAFYDLYEKAFIEKKELHITEKHEEFGPMIIDIDFRYEYDTFERKHTMKHVKDIVELYVNEICLLFNVNIDDPECTSFVFERNEMYKSKGFTKDGIHIIFPYIVSYPAPQYYIRDNILKKIGDVIADLDLKNTISDIVDRAVISQNNWLLYGSNKDKPKGNPYYIKYIFDGFTEEIDQCEYFKDKDSNLTRFFSIRNKKLSDLTPIQETKLNVIESLTKKKIIKKSITNINYDTNKIRELVSILNIERADNYNQWLEVGWTLHNIDPNSQELLDIWIDFSKTSSKFKDGECEKVWDRSKNEGLTIATLHYWAKSDNYKKYLEFKSKDLDKFIDISVKTQTNYDIANVLFKMYEYEYVYSDKNWYIYKNHRWSSETDGMSLRKLISDDLCKKYFFIMSKYNQLGSNSEASDAEREEFKKKGRDVLEIVKKLKTTSFKNNIMTECQELFHDKDFVKKLDTNPYLIGFNNGVYDLNKCEMRDGRPDDYIELNTEIDKIDFDTNNENWADLEKFVTTVFVDEEMRTYFMLYLASCLQGHNAEEKFRIWIGCGSNGKSKILELFVRSYGNYAIKFPITLLTGKRPPSNACTPEVLQSKGKRFAYFEEPSENEYINAGLLKEYTGGDKIKARGLHKDPIEFKPQFKIALLCNDIPKAPAYDTGYWRRVETIEFKSRFCDNPKEPNEFPIDKHLSVKMKSWAELFMALLLDVYYVKYKTSGIKVPHEVIKYTLDYQRQCDTYTDFTVETIMETKQATDNLELNGLYEEFRSWYENSFGGHKCPNKMEFKKYLKKKYGTKKVTGEYIKGFRMKTKEEKQEMIDNPEKSIMGY